MHSNQTKQVTRSQTANDEYTVLLQFEKDCSEEVFQRLSILRGHTPPTVVTTKASEAGRGSVQDSEQLSEQTNSSSTVLSASSCLTPRHGTTLQALEPDSEKGTS